MQTLRKTFFNDAQTAQLYYSRGIDGARATRFLDNRFHTLSMKYSSRQRSNPRYRNLVARSVQTYLRRQIIWPSLSWSPDVRVAFAFKLNAMAIIEALKGQLELGNTTQPLGEKLIAASQSGFPNAVKLKAIAL